MARTKKNNASPTWTGMPTTERELKEIKAAIEATYEFYSDIETSKGQIKDVYDELKEKYGMPKRLFNFLAKNNYTGNFLEVLHNNSELEDAYNAYERVNINE